MSLNKPCDPEMKTERLIRVNELIRREIAANLHRFVHGTDVDVGTVTITRVAVSSNLRSARVWVSVFSGSAFLTRVMGTLLDRRKEIQAHLGRTLKIKYTPRLYFEADDSLKEGDRVLALLNSLPEDGDQSAADQSPGEAEVSDD